MTEALSLSPSPASDNAPVSIFFGSNFCFFFSVREFCGILEKGRIPQAPYFFTRKRRISPLAEGDAASGENRSRMTIKIQIWERKKKKMAEIQITKDNFDEIVMRSEKPILLDFWATWCGPCRMLAPIIAEIAEEKQGEVIVGKVNVDEEPELASEFSIASIPTVMVFKNGEVTNTSIGYATKEELEALL